MNDYNINKCGMELLIHSQTKTVEISSHTLLGMWLCIHIWIKMKPY